MDVRLRLPQLVLLPFVVHKFHPPPLLHGVDHDHTQKPLHRGVTRPEVPYDMCNRDTVYVVLSSRGSPGREGEVWV